MLRIGSILHLILQLFLFALLGRLILDYVRMFKPSWRPSGIILILVEAIYTITDRPMNFVRRNTCGNFILNSSKENYNR